MLRPEISVLCFPNNMCLSSMLLCNPCTPENRLFSEIHGFVGDGKNQVRGVSNPGAFLVKANFYSQSIL